MNATTALSLPILRRLSAFTEDPSGGNPAGVWLGIDLPAPSEMLAIAAKVGYSETAFLAPTGDNEFSVRYYSPRREISFCGHATIAAGVLVGQLRGAGHYRFDTAVGPVPVDVSLSGGAVRASLTSVRPEQRDVPDRLLSDVLRAVRWTRDQLDPAIPAKLAWAGAWHLVLAVSARSTLDALDYDYAALERLMLDANLTTLQLVWREDAQTFHARNPFPVGGVVEDPATGAAAAALGGYLRDAGLMVANASFTIHQGVAMGRPSRIEVNVPAEGGVTVTGTAVMLDENSPSGVSEPERLAREFLRRVWRSPADLDAIDELMTEDYVITSAGTIVRGREDFKAWVRRFHELLHGATNEVLEVFTDSTGSRAVSRWICRGRSRGVFGLAADDAPVAFSGIAIWSVRDGRLAECWVERSGLEAVRAHSAGARSA